MHPLADTGRVIAGRYRLQAPIGRGAMGVLWRARDQLLDREVAVKEVQIADTLTEAERANAYQRTLREAKTAARLNHPAVVAVYDVCEDLGRPWIVMQLVHAQSLDQVLAACGRLPPRRAAEMARQLLGALSVAHAAGVLHRDVKPSNVLLGRDDHAVLTDFGIATFAGDTRLTQTGMVMGSPGFTAPERIRGEDATPASDLWSLGATLFAAVEGHGPFDRRGGAITTMSAIINEDAPEAPAAAALGPVIAALLRREPADRPAADVAAQMITRVLPLLPDTPAGAPAGYQPTSLPAPPRPRQDAGLPRDLSPAEQTMAGPPPGLSPGTRRPAGFGASGAQTGATAVQPDFSAWYASSPRAGPASAPPGPAPPRPAGPRSWSGGGQEHAAAPRRPGLGWKGALVALALLGAAAGAATVVLLHNRHPGTPQGGPAAGSPLPPALLATAINQPLTGPAPAGYRSYAEAASAGEQAGFRMDVPAGWTVSRTGTHQTRASDPGTSISLLADLTPHTYPDMLREARYIEAQSIPHFPGYQRLDLRALTIRGTPGAIWKFTWLADGARQTALDLLFALNTPAGPQSYALYATAPSRLWLTMQPAFDEELRSFGPLAG